MGSVCQSPHRDRDGVWATVGSPLPGILILEILNFVAGIVRPLGWRVLGVGMGAGASSLAILKMERRNVYF